MAKILLGIALAVMLATAALGFLAKGNADKLQTALKDANQKTLSAENNLKKSKDELKTRTEELTTATGKIEEKDKEIAAQKGQMDDLNKKIAEATSSLEAKSKEVADLGDQLKKIMSTPGGATIDPAEIGKKVEELTANLTKAQAEVAESRSLVDALTQQKKNVEEKMVSLEQYKSSREKGLMRQGTSGRILAVNASWNFVVLSIGDKQGAVMGANMLVLRSGQPIAKAHITSVETSTSIADIIPGSVIKGMTVQPGDSVVFEGRNSAAGASSQPAAAAPAPALPR